MVTILEMKMRVRRSVATVVFSSLIMAGVLAVSSLQGCSYSHLDAGEETTIPLEMLGVNDSTVVNIDFMKAYELGGGDSMELQFRFNMSKEREFRLQVQDVIEVRFPETPDMNDTQAIRPDGCISLPYIGEIKAAGLKPSELESELREKYTGILQRAELYVAVREYGSDVQELKESLRNSTNGQSIQLKVRSDGYISLPMVGDVLAAGKTIPALNEEINQAYAAVSSSLSASLLLLESASNQVWVLGAVNKPGSYSITRPVNVVQALALAGGSRNDAKLSQVMTFKRRQDKMVCKVVNIDDIYRAEDNSVLTYLGADDVIYVPRTHLSKWADVAGEIRHVTDLLYFRGYSVNFTKRLDDNPGGTTVITP